MNPWQIIDLNPGNLPEYGICGYKDVKKHKELQKKIEWVREYYPEGLRIKAVIAEDGSYQGMIEYIPGEHVHRPVDAAGYMFIHCLFVGFRKEHKGKGMASALIDVCIADAKDKKLFGVATVTRKGSFMADKPIYIKKGFELADTTNPDFELLVLKFNPSAETPAFKPALEIRPKTYGPGLKILRSPQCPYTEKNVNAILETAKRKFGLEAELIELKDSLATQDSPCAFGSFCILYNGEIISHHPISNTRFENIMKARL